ncbi:DUF4003 domain-containing protein [Bacillus sp. ISL-8]|uniref:DUF4003 domain-containing protein n=1 Tax=Bacillus mycoides TaxID=1405 RepID=A0A1W6AAY8_BACMY|nr:DUF4003 domain-containing protein [Bacillus mycoides]ARJ23063.1 hypothetical protein B7492_18610 [Bacillus mycoides]MBT2581095.1 DUF4003 domain-containing protein [Bacillus sp. ISL-8]
MITLEQKLEQYTHTYAQLKGELKWKTSDSRTGMMIAAMYAGSDKLFDLGRFLEISSYIKNQVGMFSYLKSYHRFVVSATLDIHFTDYKEAFQRFLDLYEQLVAGGFSRSIFTYLAAAVLLTEENEQHDTHIQRSIQVYKRMKKDHLFLTGTNDYPLAVLLAGQSENVETLMDRVERLYQKLAKAGLRKGNDLQFLSHILSLKKDVREEILVAKCTNIWKLLKQEKVKVKQMHYPAIGLLALLEDGEKEIHSIKALIEKLQGEKFFRWHTDMNILIAIQLFVSQKGEESKATNTGLQTMIEVLIQAQQAAMMATIAASSAATSSASTSS